VSEYRPPCPAPTTKNFAVGADTGDCTVTTNGADEATGHDDSSGKWCSSPPPVRLLATSVPSMLPLVNVTAARGASTDPATPTDAIVSDVYWAKLNRTCCLSTPARVNAKFFTDPDVPDTFTRTVEPAGAVIVNPEHADSFVPSTANTLNVGLLPDRATAQVEPVAVYVVVPVAASAAQASARPRRYVSAAAKLITDSLRTAPCDRVVDDDTLRVVP